MGYTHAWRRPILIPEGIYAEAAFDCGRVLRACREAGIALAGPLGVGEPIVTLDSVAFNGVKDCGHPTDEGLGIVEPATGASGVAGPFDDVVVGEWFGGAVISARKCPGICMCETFRVDRRFTLHSEAQPPDGLYGWDCKTAFRPYDLVVTSCLVVFNHHLGDRLFPVLCSTEPTHWADARDLVQGVLGYGSEFRTVDLP